MKSWPVVMALWSMAALACTSAAPVADPNKVCFEWVQPFFDFLTLKEGRDMKRSDLSRFFSYMDTSVNGKVSMEEFQNPWQGATQMTQSDTRRIFHHWALLREKLDPAHITQNNQGGVWQSFYPRKETDTVNREGFTRAMEEILEKLPNKGCADRHRHYFD